MNKILYVNYTMNQGGIENFLMNVVRNIDRKEFNISILCYRKEKFDFEDELIGLGVRIIKIDDPSNISIKEHYKQINKIMKTEKPDIVHCNTYFDSGYVMLAAAMNNIKIRITHSHTTQGNNKVNLLKRVKWSLGRILVNVFSTNKVSCSTEAADALFGNHKKIEIITNGIEIDRYKYNEDKREEYRKHLNIPEETVIIGHVGRFDIPKNHKFIIEVFEQYLKYNNSSKLVLVGYGKLQEEIREMIKKKKIEDKVMMLR